MQHAIARQLIVFLYEKKNMNKEQGFSSLDQIKGLHCLRERKFVVCIFVVCQSVTVMDVP